MAAFLLSSKWSVPSLKGSLSSLLLKCKRQGHRVFLTFEGKTPAFLITGQDALWKESAFGAHSKRSQYCISAGGLRGKIPFNVVYASFKWLWAPGTGTWCPVYAEVSWWVCTAPFPRKIEGFFSHPNRNEREGWTIARQQEEMSLRSQQFSLLNKSAVGR